MPVVVKYNAEIQIIEAQAEGDLDWMVMEQLVAGVSAQVNETGCRQILVDCRKLSMTLSTMKIFMTPQKLSVEFKKFGIDIRGLRRALLLAKGDRNFHFFETVSHNNSQPLSLFFDRQSAIKWLKE